MLILQLKNRVTLQMYSDSECNVVCNFIQWQL